MRCSAAARSSIRTATARRSGTYHTVCVRTCDGYYFPISYSTVPSHFADDAAHLPARVPRGRGRALFLPQSRRRAWIRRCRPAASSTRRCRTPIRYRKQLISGCSCRRPGQSWADALKNADDSTTLESGDIVVTDQNAKALSQPPKPGGKPASCRRCRSQRRRHRGIATAQLQPPRTIPKRTVRVVGPPFMSSSAMPQSRTTRHRSRRRLIRLKIRRAGFRHRRALEPACGRARDLACRDR